MTGRTSPPGIAPTRSERLADTIDRAAGDDTGNEGSAA